MGSRRHVAAGLLSWVAVGAVVVGLATLAQSPTAFNRWHDPLGTLPVRVVLAVVAVVVWAHMVTGAVSALRDLVPAWQGPRATGRLRAVGAVLAPAVGLPLALVVLWPGLELAVRG